MTFIDNQSLFAVVESVSDIIYILDLENNHLQFLNTRAREMLHVTDRPYIDVTFHPNDREKRKSHLSAIRTMEDNTAKELDARLLAYDGQYKWFHIRDLVFRRDTGGQVSHITGIIRPINEPVASGDGNDIHQLLARKNRQLEYLNSELQTFTTLVAQDYLETLRQVYISLEMIISAEAHQFSNASKAHLRRAQAMLQKLNLLTKDIVSYAAIEVPDDKSSLVDLNEIVQGVKKDLGARLEAARAAISHHNLPAIKGHPILLQVLVNHILTNSIRFRHPVRPLMVDISSRQMTADETRHAGSSPGRSYQKVEIKDNGTGFDPADKEKIFEMFYQGHDKAKYKGSGMGLAIVRKIMDIHGGYVIADTIPGEGTSICCYFPI